MNHDLLDNCDHFRKFLWVNSPAVQRDGYSELWIFIFSNMRELRSYEKRVFQPNNDNLDTMIPKTSHMP